MYNAEKTIIGTWGELWINSELISECTGLQAKATLQKLDIPMCGRLSKAFKVSGWEGKGTVTLNKVSSRMAKLIGDNLRQGRQVVCTIISKLADPTSDGVERVCLKGVKFDDLTLADWSANKALVESLPFTFEDFEYIDMI